MAQKPHPADAPRRRGKGFAQAGSLITGQVRKGSHSRGFAEAKLLTSWEAVVGPQIAQIARPKKVTYARGGFGATLVIEADGARGPELSMMEPQIKERVNACYGYNAITKVQITQIKGKAMVLHEPPAAYVHDRPEGPAPDLDLDNVTSDELRNALENLGRNVLSRSKS